MTFTRRGWLHLIAALVIVALAMGAAMALSARKRGTETADTWLTQTVERGAVRRAISATGSLTPVNLIQVGTQVSGTIARLHVDFNAQVKVGQLMAELDTTALDAELAQVQAQRASAQAALDLARSQAARQEGLLEKGYISRAEADQALANARSAQAALDQQQAALRRSAFNRRNAEIRSPVAGTVISREVSVGQTVAASLQTPVLFKIAQDLREMQIEASIAEADVGLLREGQTVRFTVDAFPDRAFEGRVRQIRNNHQVQQNVVTYTAVIAARNDELALRPGMTAYVTVTVGERLEVTRIPNAALRYAPPDLSALTETLKLTSTILSALLGSIAVISLMVGGIGIMNIMLVSVTERTRGIGLRMALGARRASVLGQFLIESVLLSLAGAFVGLALGFGAGWLVARSGALTPVYSASSVGLSLGVAIAVGVGFGFWPARRAAQLEPVEALRYQ